MTADGTDDRGIPPFRPGADGGIVQRAVQLAFSVRPARRFITPTAKSIDPLLHRLTRGRLGLRLAMPFASLKTTGAKSGQPRTTAVLYFTDGDDVILIASNYGSDRQPAWYHNLKAHPQALLARGDRHGTYTATEVMEEPERERLFALADHVYLGFADYRERTGKIGRRIPIMRLRLTR